MQIAVLLLSVPAHHRATAARDRRAAAAAVRRPSPWSLARWLTQAVPETKLQAFVTPKHLPVPVPARRLAHTPSTHLLADLIFGLSISPHLSLHMSSPIMLTLSEDRTLAIRPVP